MWDKLRKLPSDPRFQFAVGLGLFVVIGCGLANNSLRSDIDTIRGIHLVEVPTESGGTTMAAPPAIEGILGLVWQAVWFACVSVGGWLIASFVKAVALAKGIVADVKASHSVGQAHSVGDDPNSLRSLTLDLGRAAIANDLDKMEEIRWKIRKPQAIAELSAAYEANDKDAIDALSKELSAAIAPVAVKRKAGSNG